jgi:hypothetical protein
MSEPEVETPDAESKAPEDWRVGIEDGRLREFASRFSSPADAVKTAFDLRQKLSTWVVPGTPAGYDPALHPEIAGLFHQAQVSTHQAETLNRGWNELMEATRAAQVDSDAKALSRAEGELRRQWGADYDRKRALAERAVAQFHDGDPSEILNLELRDGRLLGSLPSFIRYAAAVGDGLMEDTLHGGEVAAPSVSIEERLNEIHAWQYADNPALRAKYRSEATQTELRELYRAIHGDGPVIGAEGRRA